jgi:hypothetical protein
MACFQQNVCAIAGHAFSPLTLKARHGDGEI